MRAPITASLRVALVLTGAVVLLHADRADAFRFLCNSIDADGSVSSDGCGTCSQSTAARWIPAILNMRVDTTTVPSGVSSATWQQNVATSMSNWNNVSGQTLVISNVGEAQTHDFGSNQNSHEIFWVLSRTEFQNKTFSSADGALGVTTTPRFCGTPGEIVDADIIMNGTGSFSWNCDNFGCSDVVSTLTHELGHAFGLGHPCVGTNGECTAIMMAVSAIDFPAPQFDDQQGIRALYPGTPGGIGTGCSQDSQCTFESGAKCITVTTTSGPISYCSKSCGTCPEGFECDAVDGEGDVCVFAGGSAATPVGVGESCLQRPCEDACTNSVAPGCNVCACDSADCICYAGCDASTGQGCGANEECLALQGGGAICIPGGDRQRGQTCSQASLCTADLVCVLETQTSGVCRGTCNASTGQGCLASETCFGLQDGSGACFPAGNVQEGGLCEAPFDCAVGKVCLVDDRGADGQFNTADDLAHCYQRCDQGFSCSSGSQTCQAIQGGGVSYCDPINTGNGGEGEGEPGEGEGEGEGEPSGEGGACNPRRGHYDCQTGTGCVDEDDDGEGVCTAGAEGTLGFGALCEDSAECLGGICSRGVCTKTCDAAPQGCIEGYSCNLDVAPGGVCLADSCRDDPDICAEGYHCEYSSAKRNVCVKGPKPLCSCDSTGEQPLPLAGGAAALVLLGVLRRRRIGR